MDWGSRTALVEEFFGEGIFRFQLSVGELVQLQELTGAGPGFLLIRIQDGSSASWIGDVKHTLRLGLIGGGMAADLAFQLVERQVRAAYLLKASLVAIKVLAAAYVGREEEREPGEPKGTTKRRRSPREKSAGASSTALPQPPE